MPDFQAAIQDVGIFKTVASILFVLFVAYCLFRPRHFGDKGSKTNNSNNNNNNNSTTNNTTNNTTQS